jgi:predicted Fe-Mo cluster-binding NifX family protein
VISSRFGKAPFFAFVGEDGTIIIEPNPDLPTVKMFDWMRAKGTQGVITAHIGPKPFKMFAEKKIKVFNPGKGKVSLIQSLGMMEIGKLERITEENLHRFYTDKAETKDET